jgi:hypothetical protein
MCVLILLPGVWRCAFLILLLNSFTVLDRYGGVSVNYYHRLESTRTRCCEMCYLTSGRELEYLTVGSACFRPTIQDYAPDGKESDSAWKPIPRRPNHDDWPTLVIEAVQSPFPKLGVQHDQNILSSHLARRFWIYARRGRAGTETQEGGRRGVKGRATRLSSSIGSCNCVRSGRRKRTPCTCDRIKGRPTIIPKMISA